MPKAKSLKKKGGSCQVNFPISKSPCFGVDVSQYKSPCKVLPLDKDFGSQTGGKKSARKNKKRNLRKNKKKFNSKSNLRRSSRNQTSKQISSKAISRKKKQLGGAIKGFTEISESEQRQTFNSVNDWQKLLVPGKFRTAKSWYNGVISPIMPAHLYYFRICEKNEEIYLMANSMANNEYKSKQYYIELDWLSPPKDNIFNYATGNKVVMTEDKGDKGINFILPNPEIASEIFKRYLIKDFKKRDIRELVFTLNILWQLSSIEDNENSFLKSSKTIERDSSPPSFIEKIPQEPFSKKFLRQILEVKDNKRLNYDIAELVSKKWLDLKKANGDIFEDDEKSLNIFLKDYWQSILQDIRGQSGEQDTKLDILSKEDKEFLDIYLRFVGEGNSYDKDHKLIPSNYINYINLKICKPKNIVKKCVEYLDKQTDTIKFKWLKSKNGEDGAVTGNYFPNDSDWENRIYGQIVFKMKNGNIMTFNSFTQEASSELIKQFNKASSEVEKKKNNTDKLTLESTNDGKIIAKKESQQNDYGIKKIMRKVNGGRLYAELSGENGQEYYIQDTKEEELLKTIIGTERFIEPFVHFCDTTDNSQHKILNSTFGDLDFIEDNYYVYQDKMETIKSIFKILAERGEEDIIRLKSDPVLLQASRDKIEMLLLQDDDLKTIEKDYVDKYTECLRVFNTDKKLTGKLEKILELTNGTIEDLNSKSEVFKTELEMIEEAAAAAAAAAAVAAEEAAEEASQAAAEEAAEVAKAAAAKAAAAAEEANNASKAAEEAVHMAKELISTIKENSQNNDNVMKLYQFLSTLNLEVNLVSSWELMDTDIIEVSIEDHNSTIISVRKIFRKVIGGKLYAELFGNFNSLTNTERKRKRIFLLNETTGKTEEKLKKMVGKERFNGPFVHYFAEKFYNRSILVPEN